MPRLRSLSGADVATILKGFGFELVSQRGSHMKLKRITETGKQTLTVPAHAELDRGTLKAIIRQASRFVPEQDLHPHFYA
jgi:predicted RNA binding protein YcfA (HicA-like mRNA interferase family)